MSSPCPIASSLAAIPTDDPLWDEACDHVWKLDGMALHRAQENFMLDHPEIYAEFEEHERRRKYAQLTKNAPTREPEDA